MGRISRKLLRGLRQARHTVWSKNNEGKFDWVYAWHETRDNFKAVFIYSWYEKLEICYQSIERVVKWIPILWEDRNWDHSFILKILQHKIRFTRECIAKYGHHTSAERDCHNMRIAEILLERLQDPNKYTEKDWDEFHAKYPSRLFSDCIKNSDGTFSFPPPNELETKESKKLFEKEAYMEKQDWEYLMKHLTKHLKHWWD